MIYPGAGRKVYPGFLQLAGFMTMNLGSHLVSHWEMFKHLVVGDEESADATRDFYDEYRSVCDMTRPNSICRRSTSCSSAICCPRAR